MEQRPTHFLALRLSHDPALVAAAERAQAALCAAGLERCVALAPASKAHVSLLLLRLPSPGDVALAARALRDLSAGGTLGELRLAFPRLGCFESSGTVFMEPEDAGAGAEALAALQRACADHMREALGPERCPPYGFTPHGTLAKRVPGGPGAVRAALGAAAAAYGPPPRLVRVAEVQLCRVGGRARWYEVAGSCPLRCAANHAD